MGFFKFRYIPALVLLAAIIINHTGANDKAPFVVLAAGIVSLLIGTFEFFTLSPIKALIAFAPLILLIVLVVLSRLGMVDLMPILGFR